MKVILRVKLFLLLILFLFGCASYSGGYVRHYGSGYPTDYGYRGYGHRYDYGYPYGYRHHYGYRYHHGYGGHHRYGYH